MSQTAHAVIRPHQQQRIARAEERIHSFLNIATLGRQIDKISSSGSSFEGAGIFFIDANYNILKLREFNPQCRRNPIYLVLKEPETLKNELMYAAELSTRERESKLVLEASMTLVTCGAAVLSWIVVLGAGAAAPISGGASTAVSYLAAGAALAGGTQCVNSIFRTGMEVVDPERLDYLDSEVWYTHASNALDVISLAGAGAATYSAIRSAQALKASSGKSYRQALAGLNRQERKRLTEEIIRRNHPGVSNRVLKIMVRSGGYPTRYTTRQINQALRNQIKDSVAASLSFYGSMTAGVVRSLAVGVYEVLD